LGASGSNAPLLTPVRHHKSAHPKRQQQAEGNGRGGFRDGRGEGKVERDIALAWTPLPVPGGIFDHDRR